MNLTFDPERHKYALDGVELPSVSKVKEPLTDFSMVAPDVMKKAQEWGNAIHLMAKLYFEEQLDFSSLDDELFGPLEALERWLEEVKPFDGPPALVDIKSRLYDRVADPVQVSGGYYQLWKENRELIGTEPWIEKPLASVKFRYAGTPDIIIPPRHGEEEFLNHRILYLGRDGKYTYTPCYDRNAWPVFAHLLSDYWRSQATQELIKSWRNRV